MTTVHSKSAWLDAYLLQLRVQRKLSPHTVDAYRRDLHELLAFSGDIAWEALPHSEVRRHAFKLHASGLTPRSIARKLSSWRGFFSWLSSETSLDANPVDGVRAPRRASSLPKALSVDDAVHLVAPGQHQQGQQELERLCDRAMFELLYSSGLRVSELTSLDTHFCKADTERHASLGWLDLANFEVVVTGKGNKMRKVPVGKGALVALSAWLAARPPARDGSAALFLSARGTRISPRVLQLRLKKHALVTGIPANVHPHVLRHSFASHVLQSSGDLRAVQEMLGHASITSTQVYTALDFQHLSAVYDKAHPRARSK